MPEDLNTHHIVTFMEETGRKLAVVILKGRDVSDALQEATIKGLDKRKDCRSDTKQGRAAWLKSILRNICFDFLRQRELQCEVLLDNLVDKIPEDREDAISLVLAAESQVASERRAKILSADIEAALSALPSSQRVIVDLYLRQDMTTRKIAAHLGLDSEAVRGRLYRGLHELRRQLEVYNSSRFPENLGPTGTDSEKL